VVQPLHQHKASQVVLVTALAAVVVVQAKQAILTAVRTAAMGLAVQLQVRRLLAAAAVVVFRAPRMVAMVAAETQTVLPREVRRIQAAAAAEN
jgi:ABC-type antimicrobial peptide transport system permease subunit